MNGLIQFGTGMTLLFATLAQTGSLSPRVGYGAAGFFALSTAVLAIVRYKRRKDAGE